MVADTAIAAEGSGASWFTVMDHYFQIEQFRTAHDPMLEGYTTLGFVAAVTKRMRLGTVVTGVTYRHPGLLSKIVTTLDVLSEGRAFLGIGAAWYEREHLALGVPYPPIVIGGSGEKKTLRMVAQYAEATNLIVADAAAAAHKLEVLKRHCDDLDRDYDSIEKTVMAGMADPLSDPDGFLRSAESYAALGIEHIHLRAVTPDPVAFVTEFGQKVAPRLSEL